MLNLTSPQSHVRHLQDVPEAFVIEFRRIMHAQLNSLFLIQRRRCLFPVSRAVEHIHMDIQNEDHDELDAIRNQHSQIRGVVSRCEPVNGARALGIMGIG